MKHRLRKLTSALISIVMIFGVLTVAPFTVSASTSDNWSWPTSVHSIKSDWPNYSSGSYHGGTDFSVALNSPVYSTCDGEVVAVTTLTTSYGKHIKIKATVNGSVVYIRYCHLNSFAVSVGDKVQSGQLIAYSGSTGNSTGPHLHYEVRNSNDTYGSSSSPNLNPRNYLPGTSYTFETNGNNPTGCLDGLVGGTGTVTVSGWAFDRDDMSASLNIHVYIGGQAGDSNAEGYGYIIANEGRGDVNAAYGCGDYHGFSSTIFTSKTGIQPVYIYAINVGGGENVLIGSGTVNISADTEKPKVEITYLSQITTDSFRVCVIPKDNVGIKNVRIATWTQSDQSDLIWHDARFNGSETYFVDLNRSDYSNKNNSIYHNHIYIYDYAGNYGISVIAMVYETNPPVISNITISQVSKSGFRINCKVSDDTGISSIKFPTWTSYNGQDDIIWYEGIVKNGTATCYVKANEHNNETGPYTTHIYLYDTYGNLSTAPINGIVLKDEPTEVSSVEYKGKIYKVFNSGFGWNNAKLWCESQGGHLATINSEEEWEIIKKALNDFNGAKCWLGAENKSGSWKWVTGEELSFTKWAQNQPDCCGNNEFYLGTFGNDSLESLNCYLWNDYAESGVEVGGFVCEFEYTCGDVNNDGSINITDTTAIQKHIASINTLDENALIRADVNSDSSVDIKDATLIQQYCAGLIDKF